MDQRLNNRYHRLVIEHMNVSEKLSAGLKAIPDKVSSFSSTQAAWRFYANEAVELSVLQQPLTQSAHQGILSHCTDYALCMHDWSRLAFKHENKNDTYAITHKTDVGYDLQTSLIVCDTTGRPIAPVAQRLVSSEGSYATYYENAKPTAEVKSHLEEVSDCIAHLETKKYPKPLVHIIDRESDSIFHIRAWESSGYHWLVRVKGGSTAEYKGEKASFKKVSQTVEYHLSRQVNYHGKVCDQFIAEASVCVTRPAKPHKKKIIKGEPVNARLVVSQIRADDGEVLAEWFLLTNVTDVEADIVALWYYWRWEIESYFKLLKSAGHHLESWQQESAPAIFKRLLVASMACVTVWEIGADKNEDVAEFRSFLIKLSGRQVRRKVGFTYPALLAGLWIYLSMIEVFSSYSSEELNSFNATAHQFLGKDV